MSNELQPQQQSKIYELPWQQWQLKIYELWEGLLTQAEKAVISLPTANLVSEISQESYGKHHYLIPANLTMVLLTNIFVRAGIAIFVGNREEYVIKAIPTKLRVICCGPSRVRKKRSPRANLLSIEETLTGLLMARLSKQKLSFVEDAYLVCRNKVEPCNVRPGKVISGYSSVHPKFENRWMMITALGVSKDYTTHHTARIYFPQAAV